LGGGAFLASFAAPGHAGDAPTFTALPTPPQARNFSNAKWGFDGWIYASNNALYLSDGSVWNAPGSLMVAEPLPTGEIIAAGRGFCSVISHGHERRLLSNAAFGYGAELDGVVLVASAQGVWAVSRDGVLASLPLKGSSLVVYVFRWNSHLFVTSRERGNFIYENRRFVPYHFPWGDSTWFQISDDPGGFFASAADRTVWGPSATTTQPLALPQSLRERLHRDLPTGLVRWGDELLITTLNGGWFGYRVTHGVVGDETFEFSNRELGGSPEFLAKTNGRLVLGTSTGVYLVADPSIYSARKIATGGEVLGIGFTPSGAHIYSPGGAFRLDGSPVPGERQWLGSFATPAGTIVVGFAQITLPTGRVVVLGDRDAPQIVPYGGDFAVVHGPRFSFVSPSGQRTEISIPAANSIARLGDEIVVGTADGAFRSTGRALNHWVGSGATSIASDHGRFLAAVDVAGDFYDESGRRIGRLADGARVLGAAVWNDVPVYLLQLTDGRFVLGSFAAGRWTPYAFPLPVMPVGVAVENRRFCVIGADSVVFASRLEAAPPIDARPHLADASGSVPPIWALPNRTDGVSLVIPPAVSPWELPAYTVRVSDGDWEPVKPSSHYSLPRLPWGQTEVALRADLGGRIDETHLIIRHASPWWAQWPAIVGDFLLLAVLTGAVVQWRTLQLRRRALTLEHLVGERTAELRKAQSAREEFFSSVSHEIRNPLNGVIGLCDMLNEAGPALGGRERSLVGTMKGCANQLRTILDDVLDFSRIDRGQIHLHEEVFELTAAIDGAARGIDPRLERCRLEPGDPIWLRGDSGKLRQVITNLVSNAIKYGQPPLASLRVALNPEVAGMLGVEIVVSNTGPTIAADDIESLFDGFTRGRDALKRNIPGMGLGLAVSRRLMLAMKGSLVGRSQDGLTEFVARISLPQVDPPAELESTAAAPVEKVARALAIEDEAYNRLILGHILAQLGYEVDWAVDGKSALELAGANAYDLILTDFVLPDTDGATLARTILAGLPEPKPPVVAVTAYSTKEKVAEAKAAGITGFVAKPISRRKLEAAILGVGEVDRSSRPIEVVAASNGDWDFGALLRLPDGRQALAEFGEGLGSAWERVESLVARLGPGVDEGPAAKAVHSFRGRVLAVEAHGLVEQLASLEQAVRSRSASPEDLSRLCRVIGPLVQQLAAAASDQALSSNQSG
jgi:signal transduction histidine kinase/ActR/RegA family two-component response regulator